MSPCLSDDDVAGLSMLPPGDPERRAADAHAATCPRCALALKRAGEVLGPLAILEAARPPDVAATRTSLLARLAEDARLVAREGWVAMLGATVLTGLALSLFRVMDHGVLAVLEGVGALGVAAFAAFHARTLSGAKTSVLVVVAASLSILALQVDEGASDAGLAADHGMGCLMIMGVTALVPAALVALLASRALEPGASWRTAARTGAAALSAQGGLALLCTSDGALHLGVFHLGGLLATMGIGAGIFFLVSRARGQGRGEGAVS
jgi:hypothetical protein